jgi:hypothetical protein
MEDAAMPRRGGGAAGGWLVGPRRNHANSGALNRLIAPTMLDGLS